RATSAFNRPYPTRTVSDWTLWVEANSLHHAIRASTGLRPDGFAVPRLLGHAVFPFCFRFQVGPTTPVTGNRAGSPALDPSRVTRGSTASSSVQTHTIRDAPASSILPGRASLVTAGREAPGTTNPLPKGC